MKKSISHFYIFAIFISLIPTLGFTTSVEEYEQKFQKCYETSSDLEEQKDCLEKLKRMIDWESQEVICDEGLKITKRLQIKEVSCKKRPCFIESFCTHDGRRYVMVNNYQQYCENCEIAQRIDPERYKRGSEKFKALFALLSKVRIAQDDLLSKIEENKMLQRKKEEENKMRQREDEIRERLKNYND